MKLYGESKMRLAQIFLIFLISSISNIALAQDCTQTIESNDAMQFDLTEIRVSTECKSLTINLKHIGNLPAQFMGHNWVLSTTEDGGQEASVTFDVSTLDPGGDYTYFCTFPGHYAIMKKKFIIE